MKAGLLVSGGGSEVIVATATVVAVVGTGTADVVGCGRCNWLLLLFELGRVLFESSLILESRPGATIWDQDGHKGLTYGVLPVKDRKIVGCLIDGIE